VAEYRLRPKARADIDGVWHYTVRTRGGPRARRSLAAIRDACAELVNRPALGKGREELWPGLRSVPSGKHLVYYLVAGYGVDVVRVLREGYGYHQSSTLTRRPVLLVPSRPSLAPRVRLWSATFGPSRPRNFARQSVMPALTRSSVLRRLFRNSRDAESAGD
jgi:toxin ParE1/3/4